MVRNKTETCSLFQTSIEGFVSITTSKLMKNAFESLWCLRFRSEIWNTIGALGLVGRRRVHLPPEILKLRSSKVGFEMDILRIIQRAIMSLNLGGSTESPNPS